MTWQLCNCYSLWTKKFGRSFLIFLIDVKSKDFHRAINFDAVHVLQNFFIEIIVFDRKAWIYNMNKDLKLLKTCFFLFWKFLSAFQHHKNFIWSDIQKIFAPWHGLKFRIWKKLWKIFYDYSCCIQYHMLKQFSIIEIFKTIFISRILSAHCVRSENV